MRQLVVGALTTLDGVMQAPGGPDEDRDRGFPHGGWLVPYFDETFLQVVTDWTKQAGAFLLGRRTYEIFAASWPNSTDPSDEVAVALNSRPKYVATRTLDRLAWNNSHVLDGDVVAAVSRLKSQDGGEIQVHGSSQLLQTLLAHDLVDRLRIWQFPVVLGTGKRLFGAGARPRGFALVESRQNSCGAVLQVYDRVGDLKYGEVEVGEGPVVFD